MRGAKRRIQATLPCRIPPIVVASMGRSGSGLTTKALKDGLARLRFGFTNDQVNRVVYDLAFDLEGLRLYSGVVYKTHAFPDEIPRQYRPKVVFLYSLASETAASVISCRRKYDQRWIDKHMEHLRAEGPFEDIFQRDVLRMEEQIDSWLNADGLDVLALRYERIWAHQAELEAFVGYPFQLPAQRARESGKYVSGEEMSALRSMYGELDAKIETLGDFKLNLRG